MPDSESPLVPKVALSLVEIVPAVNRSLRILLARWHHVVTVPQFRILTWLKSSADLTLKELARREGVAPPTMSRAVDGLLDKGWLTRKAAVGDRRCVRITLTEPGSSLVSTIRREMALQLEAQLTGWDPEALTQLLESLDRLKASTLIFSSSGATL